MKHFPIFVALEGKRVVLSGGGEAAVATLRLILKTEAKLTLVSPNLDDELQAVVTAGRAARTVRETTSGRGYLFGQSLV